MSRVQLQEQFAIEREWRQLAYEAGSPYCWPMLTLDLLTRFWRAYS